MILFALYVIYRDNNDDSKVDCLTWTIDEL